MPWVDPFHIRVAQIALEVAKDHGFALGGGLALIAHGVLDRPTEDVDLFSDVDESVPAAAERVRVALEAAGVKVAVDAEGSDLGETIYGLDGQLAELVAYRDDPDEDGVRLSLGHLSRAHSPVVLDIGPVLHLADLRASKVAALVARVEPRDFVDVGVFLGEFSPAELLVMARQIDPGMEDQDVTDVGRRLDETPDRLLAGYGLDGPAIAELRRRFAAWPRPS